MHRQNMIDWLLDCYPDDAEEIEGSTNTELARVIEREYDGGMEWFIKAG